MFNRFRTALAALINPNPAPGPADTEPAPNPGDQVPAPGPADIPHPADYADGAAFYAAVLEAAARLRADEAANANTTRDVSGHGRALQARDVQDVHMDTHHHGSTVTNNTGPGATVGVQAGHVNGGVFNMGGHNRISGAAIGTGATVHNGTGDINQTW